MLSKDAKKTESRKDKKTKIATIIRGGGMKGELSIKCRLGTGSSRIPALDSRNPQSMESDSEESLLPEEELPFPRFHIPEITDHPDLGPKDLFLGDWRRSRL